MTSVKLSAMASLKRNLIVTLMVTAIFHSQAIADSNTPSSTQLENRQNSLWLFGGGGIGLLNLRSDVAGESDSKIGPRYHLSGLSSLYYEQFRFDVGLGWSYSKLSGESKPGGTGYMTTKAMQLEFAPNYRISNAFSLGLATDLLFGTDLTYSENVTDQTSTLLLAGLKASYDQRIGSSYLLRYGAKVMTNVTGNSDRRHWLALLEVHFGLPFLEPTYSNLSATCPPAEPCPPCPPQKVAKVVPAKQISKSVILVTLSNRQVNFETGRSELKEDSKKYFKKFAAILSSRLNYWKTIQISGHTDIRGGAEMNRKLSRDRANAVKNFLVQSGLPANRLNAVGYGPDRPLDPADNLDAYAKNRRVESSISGVKENSDLVGLINDIP